MEIDLIGKKCNGLPNSAPANEPDRNGLSERELFDLNK